MVCKVSLWSGPCPHSGLEALRLRHSRDLHPLPRNRRTQRKTVFSAAPLRKSLKRQ